MVSRQMSLRQSSFRRRPSIRLFRAYDVCLNLSTAFLPLKRLMVPYDPLFNLPSLTCIWSLFCFFSPLQRPSIKPRLFYVFLVSFGSLTSYSQPKHYSRPSHVLSDVPTFSADSTTYLLVKPLIYRLPHVSPDEAKPLTCLSALSDLACLFIEQTTSFQSLYGFYNVSLYPATSFFTAFFVVIEITVHTYKVSLREFFDGNVPITTYKDGLHQERSQSFNCFQYGFEGEIPLMVYIDENADFDSFSAVRRTQELKFPIGGLGNLFLTSSISSQNLFQNSGQSDLLIP